VCSINLLTYLLTWYHCHSLSLASVKSRLVLPFWYRLTRVVLDKGTLNGCVCDCLRSTYSHQCGLSSSTPWWKMTNVTLIIFEIYYTHLTKKAIMYYILYFVWVWHPLPYLFTNTERLINWTVLRCSWCCKLAIRTFWTTVLVHCSAMLMSAKTGIDIRSTRSVK